MWAISHKVNWPQLSVDVWAYHTLSFRDIYLWLYLSFWWVRKGRSHSTKIIKFWGVNSSLKCGTRVSSCSEHSCIYSSLLHSSISLTRVSSIFTFGILLPSCKLCKWLLNRYAPQYMKINYRVFPLKFHLESFLI